MVLVFIEVVINVYVSWVYLFRNNNKQKEPISGLEIFRYIKFIFGGNGKWLMMENGFWSVKNDKYFYHRGLHWLVKISLTFSQLKEY